MKVKFFYKKCENTGESGYLPKKHPEDWFTVTETKILVHDIFDHYVPHFKKDNTNFFEEIIALGRAYNNNPNFNDNDIKNMFYTAFEILENDNFSKYNNKYLEYHYKNEYYNWFEKVLLSIKKDLDKYIYRNYKDKLIKTLCYYFKKGADDSLRYSYYNVFNLLEKFLRYNENLDFTVQIIKSKRIFKIIDFYNDVWECQF